MVRPIIMLFSCHALSVVFFTYSPHGDSENTGLRTTVPIYAEPTRKLYQLLELTDNLDMPGSNDPKRSYYTDSFVQSVWKTLAVSENSLCSRLLCEMVNASVHNPSHRIRDALMLMLSVVGLFYL
jgi:hypothetical protein